jgi:hypothetical protein
VRTQYHFWPGDRDFDAWDVARLIRLTADLPVAEIPLESIGEVDTVYWFSAGEQDLPTVRSIVEHVRLIQAVDPCHPIILGSDGRVMDGMHRIARAMLEGRTTIRAVRFSADPEPDYRNCRPGDLPYPEDA